MLEQLLRKMAAPWAYNTNSHPKTKHQPLPSNEKHNACPKQMTVPPNPAFRIVL